MKDEIKKARDGETLRKLRLLPRLSELDPVPIIAAMKRGELDATDFRESRRGTFR